MGGHVLLAWQCGFPYAVCLIHANTFLVLPRNTCLLIRHLHCLCACPYLVPCLHVLCFSHPCLWYAYRSRLVILICVRWLSSMLGVLCQHKHSLVLSSYPIHVCAGKRATGAPCNRGTFFQKKKKKKKSASFGQLTAQGTFREVHASAQRT